MVVLLGNGWSSFDWVVSDNLYPCPIHSSISAPSYASVLLKKSVGMLKEHSNVGQDECFSPNLYPLHYRWTWNMTMLIWGRIVLKENTKKRKKRKRSIRRKKEEKNERNKERKPIWPTYSSCFPSHDKRIDFIWAYRIQHFKSSEEKLSLENPDHPWLVK